MIMENLPLDIIEIIANNLNNIEDKCSFYTINKLFYTYRSIPGIKKLYPSDGNFKYFIKYNPKVYISVRYKRNRFSSYDSSYKLLDKNYNISDCSDLINMEELDLSNTPISDVSAFIKVMVINLFKCRNVKDISPLSNAVSVNLRFTNIDDVFPLRKVTVLNLSHCHNIETIPVFCSSIVDLSYCSKLTNVFGLKDVGTVNLSYCQEVTDIEPLANVHDLNLEGCLNLIFFKDYVKIYKLNMSFTKISNLEYIKNVKVLKLAYCQNIRDISPLNHNSMVDLTGCNKIINY